MTPKCTPTLGVTLMKELQMFRALVGKEKKTQNWAPKTLLKWS